MTSTVANGLLAGNSWYLNIAGGFAALTAAELMRQTGLVAAFGASLNMWTTRHGSLIGPEAVVIQVDHEAEAIGAHRRMDVGVVGDVRETTLELLEELGNREVSGPGWGTPKVAGAIWAGS